MKRRLTLALGASLVFATFGCAWGAYGMYSLRRTDQPWLVGIPLAITIVLIVILSKCQRRVEALPSEPDSPELEERDARGRQIFSLVNLAQAVAIVVVVKLLLNAQRPELVAPIVAAIVGLHFLALAGPMEMPTHRIAGGLMWLFAFGIVAMTPRGCWTVFISVGNAIILWTCYVIELRVVLAALLRHRDSAR
jgi:hypothetical protein